MNPWLYKFLKQNSVLIVIYVDQLQKRFLAQFSFNQAAQWRQKMYFIPEHCLRDINNHTHTWTHLSYVQILLSQNRFSVRRNANANAKR